MLNVASESAFSASGNIHYLFRSSLTAKTVEALVCTKSWLSSSHDIVVFRESTNEVETLKDSILVENDNTLNIIYFFYSNSWLFW